MQDISVVSSKDIEAQALNSDTLVKMKATWFYGHFPENKYFSFTPCHDLMLNEGITGPQYTRMTNPEICKMSCYSCSLKILFAGIPLVDDHFW